MAFRDPWKIVTPQRARYDPYSSARVLRAVVQEIVDHVCFGMLYQQMGPGMLEQVNSNLLHLFGNIEFRGRPLFRWFTAEARVVDGNKLIIDLLPADEYAQRLFNEMDVREPLLKLDMPWSVAPSEVKRVVEL